MGRSRLELQRVFEKLLNTKNVYFNPPPTVELEYPCILYKLDKFYSTHAGNKVYRLERRYNATLIVTDPDSELPDKMFDIPKIAFDRSYVSDNLYHYVYTLYY